MLFRSKRIRKLVPQGGTIPKDLKSYLSLIGYPRPVSLGLQKSTSRIKAVSEMLTKKKSFEELTPTVKGKWTKLLAHNRHDVEGMKALVLRSLSPI